ncbi:DNA adenine methylase [Kamptonema cortianum]|nr:DNA adenine methylase [Geitlerinema splendidum]MDK3156228.1 DNA adenine methylase [Kamptonema cortianum]
MLLKIELKRLGTFSPLRYPGGKAAFTGILDQIIKLKQLHGSVYVEPYAGGAGAALSLLFLEKVDRIVINDLDPAIFAFWKAATEESEWFASQVATIPLSVNEWRRQRQIYLNGSEHSTRELGFALFYLNRTNRSGIVEGWPIGGLDQCGKWKIDARFNREALSARIRAIGLYRNRIEVMNSDGIALAKEYLIKNEGLVYLDPPYFAKGKSLYLNHYKSEDHKSLAKLLNRHRNSAWVLTYDNVEPIRKLYPKRRILDFSLNYSVHSAKTGSEILIPSDSLGPLFAESSR